jgi:hypothetical protein
VDLGSLLPDVWVAGHPEQWLKYRRDEAEIAASARRRRRALRRTNGAEPVYWRSNPMNSSALWPASSVLNVNSHATLAGYL